MGDIGTRIKDARARANYTQVTLAEAVGVEKSLLSKWERGVHLPSTEWMIKLAVALDVSVDYLAVLSDQYKPPSDTIWVCELLERMPPHSHTFIVAYAGTDQRAKDLANKHWGAALDWSEEDKSWTASPASQVTYTVYIQPFHVLTDFGSDSQPYKWMYEK